MEARGDFRRRESLRRDHRLAERRQSSQDAGDRRNRPAPHHVVSAAGNASCSVGSFKSLRVLGYLAPDEPAPTQRTFAQPRPTPAAPTRGRTKEFGSRPGTPLFPPTKTSPILGNLPAYDAPPGLRDGIDRLLRDLTQRRQLAGNVRDYKVLVPPEYQGDETKYEIGFLRPHSRFYAFRTEDGGQTWSRQPPTNPYLKKIADDTTPHPTPGTPRRYAAGIATLRGRGRRPTRTTRTPQARSPAPGKLPTATNIRIDDDGTTATIDLVSNDPQRSFSAKLTRGKKGTAAKSLTGKAMAVVPDDAPTPHSVVTTATLDKPGQLTLHFADWPKFRARRKTGEKAWSLTLNCASGS